MPPRTPVSTNELVRSPSRALASRSAALVARGLLDLARESNWLVKKIFSAHTPDLALSSTGQVSALPPAPTDAARLALYDTELGRPHVTLSVPAEAPSSRPGLPAAFAWSSTASDLIVAHPAWGNRLYAFDLQGKRLVGSFGEFSLFPSHLAWSESGRYFASACSGGVQARVRLWEASRDWRGEAPFAGSPLSEAGGPRSFDEWFGARPLDTEGADETTFSGFGRIAFSPDESALASVVEIEEEWADDLIVLLEIPTLRRRRTLQAQGHVTGLAWTFDSRYLIYCSAGQAYRIGPISPESESLPFGAELVACHPHLPVCLCFSSWLRSSAKGRLFIADLHQLCVFDEHAAEGVADLQWSRDGSRAYAITADGLAYVYEPPRL
jgi:WD40 repeat protein